MCVHVLKNLFVKVSIMCPLFVLLFVHLSSYIVFNIMSNICPWARTTFQLVSEHAPCFVWMCSRALIMFMLDNFRGGGVHQSNILYDIKNPPKNWSEYNNEDCEDQVDYDTEWNIRLSKLFSKVMRKLDMIPGNNVSTNVQDNQ